MDQSTFIALVNNVALLLSLALFYNTTYYKFFHGKSLCYHLFNGLVLGIICILVMLNPWVLVKGIVFDTRSILISTSGLFFGVIPTVLAITMAAAYRFYIGGSGVWTGITVMVVSGMLGLVWQYLNRKEMIKLSWINLYLFGVVVHISMLLLMFSLPGTDTLYVLKKIGLPTTLLFPLGTVFLGKLLIRQHEHEKMANALLQSESLLKETQQITKVGGWEYDLLTKKVFWTDEVYRIYEVSKDDYDPNNISQDISFYAPEDRLVMENTFKKAVDEGVPYDLTLRFRSARGNVTWVRTVASVETKNGKIIRVYGNIVDMTESMQAKQALAESEELFKSVFFHHAAVMLINDPYTGNIIDANEAAVNYYGWPYEQIITMNIGDINMLPPEELSAVVENIRHQEKFQYEFRDRRADGSVRDVEVFGTRIKIRGKDVFYCIIHDITERKLAEEKLKAERQRLHNVLEVMPMMVCLLTPDYHVAFANRALREKFGESSGRHCYEYFGNKEPCNFCETFRVLKTGEPHRWEMSSRDGATIIDVYDFPFTDVDGSPMILEVNIDITERKRAYEELREYREHLVELVKERTDELNKGRNMVRTLIDSLPDEIYAKDKESRFIMANLHVLNTFGLSQFKDILGKTDFDFLPREEAEKAYTNEYAILQPDGQMINYEDHILNRDGKERWLAVTKVPMRNREGNITGIVGINRDITELKNIEYNLLKAKEAAEIANRAKSTFLSKMSHEIRTPLNAILGFSELMQSDDGLSNKHIKWLKTINQSGEHLLTLINDILELSRIEAERITFNPSSFDLFSLLKDVEAMFKVKTDLKNLTLLFDLSNDLPINVVSDEGKLRQILINLIGNAVKFTKEGGITLRAYGVQVGDKIRFTAEVEDTGPGIAEKDIDKLFQKFGQTEAGIKEGGTGLGLVISQEYAKLMGGEITVRSEEKKRTCFTLTIDIEKSKDVVKEENQKRHVIGLKSGQKPYRILVADDRADNRELLKMILTSVGFEVEEAQNGNETIEKFKVWSPDMILMDMQMPVMNGFDAIRGIRAIEEKRTPIIAVTADAFQEDSQKAQDVGADGCLLKPFKEHEVFECIKSCLGVQYVYT